MTLEMYSTSNPYNKMNKTYAKLDELKINELNVIYDALNLIIDIEYTKELNANLFLYNSKWYYLEKYEIVAKNTYRLYLKNDILMNYREILPYAYVVANSYFSASSYDSNCDYSYDTRKTIAKTYNFPNSFNSELTNIMVLLRTY